MSADLTPQEELDRTDVMDDLLRLDGRCDPTHPLRSTYTGLARPFLRLMLLEAEVADLKHAMAKLCDRISDRIDADGASATVKDSLTDEPPADA
jgi:hypothetical protein